MMTKMYAVDDGDDGFVCWVSQGASCCPVICSGIQHRDVDDADDVKEDDEEDEDDGDGW